VMAAYERGDSRVTSALRALKDVAAAMAEALRAGDVARVATLLSDNWTQQQALDPGMRTPEMAQLEGALSAAGALGGRPPGRGRAGRCSSSPGRSHTRDRRGARRRCDGPPGAMGVRRGPRVVTAEQLAARREQIATAPDLAALLAHIRERAAPLLERLPPIPDSKALLSTDGGLCPEDGAGLGFDPWEPDCAQLPAVRQDLQRRASRPSWVRYQHLWLAERAAHLATLAVLDGNDAAAARAAEILRVTPGPIGSIPTETTSWPQSAVLLHLPRIIWIGNYLAAAALLRAGGRLDDATADDVSRVADEAANLIGDFDEGFSNRQTWNNAALAAIAGWFEDEDLAKRAIEGPTGLLEHLLRASDVTGCGTRERTTISSRCGPPDRSGVARLAGVDTFAEPKLAARVRAALLAPARTALPDFTFLRGKMRGSASRWRSRRMSSCGRSGSLVSGHENGKRERRARELARCRVPGPGTAARAVRVLPA